jgi:hypothetical protein
MDTSNADEGDVKHGGEQEKYENTIPHQVKIDARLHQSVANGRISAPRAIIRHKSSDLSQQSNAYLFTFGGER